MTDTPKRIQLRRTTGWRMPPNTVSVARPTVFGNPFTCHWPYGCPRSAVYDHGHEADGKPSMHCCVDTYWLWATQGIRGEPSTLVGRGGGLRAAFMAAGGNVERAALVAALPRLRGKHLACWCPLDKRCHADALLKLANHQMTCEAVDG